MSDEQDYAEYQEYLEYQKQQTPPPLAEEPGTLGSLGGGVLDAVTGFIPRAMNLGSSAYDAVSQGLSDLSSQKPRSLEEALLILASPGANKFANRVSNQTVPQTISDVTAAGVGAVPFLGPTVSAGVETAADMSDEYRGYAQPTSTSDKLRKFADIAASGMLPDAGIRTVGGATNWLFPNATQAVKNIGQNKKVMLSEQANTPGISAAKLNAAKGTTMGEGQLAEVMKPYEERFFNSGIVDDLDTSTRNRSQVVGQFREKLDNTRTSALDTKTRLLNSADGAGAGITLDDIDLGKLQSEIASDSASSFTAGTAQTSLETLRQLESDLGLSQAEFGSVSTGSGNRRQLSLTQAQDYVRRLDDKLREGAVYNQNPQAKAMQNPAEMARIEAETKSLSKVRGAINEAIANKVEQTLGSEARGALDNANGDIGMSIKYGDLSKRFANEGLQDFSPGSGKSLHSAGIGGVIKQVMDSVVDKVNPFNRHTGAMERGRSAIESLQQLAPYVRGETPKVYPRDVNVSGSLGALSSGIGTLGAESSFQNQNPQPPPLLPRSSAILQNPQQLMQMVAMASGNNRGLMEDLGAVLKEPNQNKRDMAMMEFTRMLPQIFEPSPYRSLWNGRIADPMEQRMYVDDLKSKHRQGSVDANYLAKSINSINADGTVLPPPPPIPPQRPQAVSTQGLERREYSY